MKSKIRQKRKKKIKIKKKNKKNPFLFYGLLLCVFFLIIITSYKYIKDNKINPNKDHSANEIKNSKKIKIVIVPGHKNGTEGALFRNIKESEMNLELSLSLAELLRNEEKFEVITPWDKKGYNPIFSDYFKKEKKSIEEFMNSKKKTTSELMKVGKIKKVEGVIHNNVSSRTALELYGINKWANENDIDIVLHVHFNDYPTRGYSREGKYSGFAIYVPESQYSNAKSSHKLAEPIYNQLAKFYPRSNYLPEQDGIVEDQKLIAIGAHGTLDSAGLLIEYGYIYEQQFLNEKIRKYILKDLALQTYIGIAKFFETDKKLSLKYDTFLLPHKWENTLQKGVKNKESVLALQTALVFEKLYPPDELDKYKCPITGNFGDCTSLALTKFQERYGIKNEIEEIGESTIRKLNELYSE